MMTDQDTERRNIIGKNHHESSSAIARSPQGSPIDSKNKVKADVIETHDVPNELYPHLLLVELMC
ncbi:hypothetical protein TSUD_107270 [Trifolium subterraneum]|uniref:Uncharacterized protein n=1 Tax=Trifolium subterraneum TaxID=3900 RepID=A0A2Z6P8F3_TRISU|nr:hypothetical protein TSUD_107270 [Trifolium subterraneum]